MFEGWEVSVKRKEESIAEWVEENRDKLLEEEDDIDLDPDYVDGDDDEDNEDEDDEDNLPYNSCSEIDEEAEVGAEDVGSGSEQVDREVDD